MDPKTLRILFAAASAPAALAPAAVATAQATVAAHPSLLAALPQRDSATWTFHHENVLGTSLQITLLAPDRATALHAEAAALRTFDQDTATLSGWLATSEFSRWAATHATPVPVSPLLYDVLSRFDAWRDLTGGALDASIEAATQLWQTAAAQGRTPIAQQIQQTRNRMQQAHWSLDPATRTATRLTGVPLTLASFTKSYITSRAADHALQAGATGVALNVGGDIVVRGSLTQLVAIADPLASAENDRPLDHLLVQNRSVATSGSYRRGFNPNASLTGQSPEFSHLFDPRTATPVSHILSSTVVARDAATSGALATAFSILPVAESQELAARTPGVDYLIVTAAGERLASPGWNALRAPQPSNPRSAPAPGAGLWNPDFELAVGLELPKASDARYRRPYIAVWVEDADHFPVRTLALWTQNPRYLPELKQWYRDDQIRNLSEGTDVSKTISSATRPPGKYTLKWDGKDNLGKLVKPGKYTLCVESSREHGGYEIERHEMNFDATPQQASLPAGKELGQVTLDYRKR